MDTVNPAWENDIGKLRKDRNDWRDAYQELSRKSREDSSLAFERHMELARLQADNARLQQDRADLLAALKAWQEVGRDTDATMDDAVDACNRLDNLVARMENKTNRG